MSDVASGQRRGSLCLRRSEHRKGHIIVSVPDGRLLPTPPLSGVAEGQRLRSLSKVTKPCWIGTAAKCECGSSRNVRLPRSIPLSSLSTFQHRVVQVLQTTPDEPETPPPTLYSHGYFNQKPVQAKLAIIQQNNEFYPDSFISFFFFFLNVGDWDFYVKRRGKLGLGLCFNTRILTVHAEMTWITDYLRNSQRPIFSCSR